MLIYKKDLNYYILVLGDKMQDWKLILHTQSYDFIFIYDDNFNNYLSFYYDNEIEISKENSFALMMPEQGFQFTKDKIDASEWKSKYSPLLKGFMESTNKKTLITDETILHILVKEDKRLSFLKFLQKHEKNLIMFHGNKKFYLDNNKEHFLPNMFNTNLDNIIETSFLQQKLKNINQTLDMTFNPFKDPFLAYEKINE